jgi:hypothetical protein
VENAVLSVALYTGSKPVKAFPLRALHVGATVIALCALLLAEPSHAHVDVRPDLVEQGAVTEIEIELPLILPGPDLVRLELDGEGIEVLGVRKVERPGSTESHWTARVRVDAPIGRAPFVLRPFYADGASVEFRQAFTVVPPPEESFPWGIVLAGSAAAAGLAAGGLVLARRRPA